MTFSIGPITINDPVFLAPMSGVSDLPFRRLVKSFGAGLVFSEMIASRPSLEQYRGSPKASRDYADEFPMAVQLAGCEPDIMAEAARIHEARGAAIIDINFGCPVKKVVTNFAGSALMRDEKLATEIMAAVAKAVSVPVTVKMRLGWDEHSMNAPRLARMAQDVGIKMVTVHGRTRNQLYNGTANWDAVHAVKDAITLPVIVNGDITSAAKADEALKLSGADGVMIGRGTYGKPWLVRQIMDHLKGATTLPDPTLSERATLVQNHYDALLSHYGTYNGNQISRKHIGWYVDGLPGADDMRSHIHQMDDPASVKAGINAYFDHMTNYAQAA